MATQRKKSEPTLAHYSRYAREYVDRTDAIDMSVLYAKFDPLLCFHPEAFRLTFGATGLFPKPVGPTLQGFLLGRMRLRVVVFMLVVRHGSFSQREL